MLSTLSTIPSETGTLRGSLVSRQQATSAVRRRDRAAPERQDPDYRLRDRTLSKNRDYRHADRPDIGDAADPRESGLMIKFRKGFPVRSVAWNGIGALNAPVTNRKPPLGLARTLRDDVHKVTGGKP